jgi:hypothetical protein
MMSPAGGESGPPHGHGRDHSRHGESGGSDELRQALVPVYDAYFVIQMALAEDDAATATSGATALTEVIGSADVSAWREISDDLVSHAGAFAGTSDIASARDAFYRLSAGMIQLHELFGHAGSESYYLAHCPMARDGAGADWLQRHDVIWNSYYGAEMLRCGSITLELAPVTTGGE